MHVEYHFLDVDLDLVFVHVFILVERVSKFTLHIISKRLYDEVAFHADLLIKNVLHHAQNNVGLYQLKDTVLELMRLVIN